MPIPRYKAPKFELKTRRTIELQFMNPITAGADLTIVSTSIAFPFRITGVKMIFDRNADNLVRHYWLKARTPDTSTVGLPNGENIFSKENPLLYFVGHAIVKVIDTNIEVESEYKYVKLHTFNGLGVAYYINCSCVIQEL